MSGGERVTCAMVTTRARKRKVGERDSLWDLVVKNDDISLTHIVPRLNQTDVKFLYDVNSETRKLIKRSSRESDLKEKFWIKEMSSISTLEFAWEHKSLWSGCLKDQTSFSEQVALTNKLELLKWVREEKKCEWDKGTLLAATQRNNLDMVKYCVANQCPIDADACAFAAEFGHLELLKYLREEVKAPWDVITLMRAQWSLNPALRVPDVVVSEQLECLRYAVANKCPGWVSYASDVDILNECVRYNQEGWPEPEQRTNEHYALFERMIVLQESLERM